MLVLGLVLLLLGLIFGLHILWVLGVIALVIGGVVLILGATGRHVGGRSHWY